MTTVELLTVSEAAAALGVSKNTLERMIAAGEIKIVRYRDRGQRRIPMSEIIRLKTPKTDGGHGR